MHRAPKEFTFRREVALSSAPLREAEEHRCPLYEGEPFHSGASQIWFSRKLLKNKMGTFFSFSARSPSMRLRFDGESLIKLCRSYFTAYAEMVIRSLNCNINIVGRYRNHRKRKTA